MVDFKFATNKWLFHVGSKPGEAPETQPGKPSLFPVQSSASRWSSDRGHGREQGGSGHGDMENVHVKSGIPNNNI